MWWYLSLSSLNEYSNYSQWNKLIETFLNVKWLALIKIVLFIWIRMKLAGSIVIIKRRTNTHNGKLKTEESLNEIETFNALYEKKRK